ncbi:MAG: 30S ribosomal protein S19 [Candidatus Doudnabacteria bacterium]|nr:30S ribosomal protein S19 [Candidatus Doudnabacteria bacterium]
MARSSKKGPYVDPKLLAKVTQTKAAGNRKAIKTWARKSTISPEMVGVNFEVHNGKWFNAVFVTESMVGHKLGEFSPTRKFSGHSKKGKIAKSTGSTGRATE